MVLFLFALICCGCVQRAIVAPESVTRQTLFAVSGAISEADTLSAVVQIDVTTAGGHYPVKAALIIKKPHYMRLEILPIIGPPDFFLTTNPEAMKIVLPARREYYQGKPTSQNLAKFLPLPFDIEDVVAIFANSYPPLGGEVAYHGYPEDNFLRIAMKSRSGNSQIVWVGSDSRLIKLVRHDQSGQEFYTAKFDDYQEGSPLAGKITVMMADGATSISIKYADYKIEKSPDLSVFDLPAPVGFKKIKLD